MHNKAKQRIEEAKNAPVKKLTGFEKIKDNISKGIEKELGKEIDTETRKKLLNLLNKLNI